ncbi:MAG: hypothetical protein SGILL_000668 [Bacillariaceae sp.]
MEIQTADSLTPELFAKLLNEHWHSEGTNTEQKQFQVDSLSKEPVDLGVLSQVYRVHLKFKEENAGSSSSPPAEWLVKLCRPDLNLSWMLKNEAAFYRRIAPHFFEAANNSNSNSTSLPFSVPLVLSGDENHVILQEVLNVETFQLMEGCPHDRIPVLLRCMAGLHATCWKSEKQTMRDTLAGFLTSPPGMGQRLHPLQQEGLFVSSWKETVDCIQFDPVNDAETLQFITEFCEQLETLKLRAICDQVHRHNVTLVHGDFHVGNCLFPKPRSMAGVAHDDRPVLVDWATAGFGNPMIDLAFFIVASTNDEAASNSRQYLEEYHKLLISYQPWLAETVSLKTLNIWFPFALLCQWMILVAYDNVCRQIAENEPDEQKREAQLSHFQRVNRKAVMALQSIPNWRETLSTLDVATEQDKEEAQGYCNKTSLAI